MCARVCLAPSEASSHSLLKQRVFGSQRVGIYVINNEGRVRSCRNGKRKWDGSMLSTHPAHLHPGWQRVAHSHVQGLFPAEPITCRCFKRHAIHGWVITLGV